jgi:hypothetical protein
MNIYLIHQTVNDDYDTYGSAVVVANSEEEARNMHPFGLHWMDNAWRYSDGKKASHGLTDWTTPANVIVELIGVADKKYKQRTIIDANFRAG